MPDQPEYGDDCADCFPIGKTPLYVKVAIGGICRGEWWEPSQGPPPNGYFDLVQSPAVACHWFTLKPEDPVIVWKPRDLITNFLANTVEGHNCFWSGGNPICTRHFTNSPGGWEGSYFYGGHAFVTIPGNLTGGPADFPASLSKVINKVTPMIDPDPRMECFPMADKHIAVRYCGKRDATNIMIKFDTEA